MNHLDGRYGLLYALGIAIVALLTATGVVLATGARHVNRPAFVVLADDLQTVDDLREYSVDEIRVGGLGVKHPSTIRTGSRIWVRGWAYADGTDAAKTAIVAIIDEQEYVHAQSHLQRPDVVTALHSPDAIDSGFELSLDTHALSPGRHTLRIGVADPVTLLLHRGPAMPLTIH